MIYIYLICFLGYMYYNGMGVEKNILRALEYFKSKKYQINKYVINK